MLVEGGRLNMALETMKQPKFKVRLLFRGGGEELVKIGRGKLFLCRIRPAGHITLCAQIISGTDQVKGKGKEEGQ